MATSSYRFVVTGTLDGDLQAIKAALMPFVHEALMDAIELRGELPLDEDAQLDLSVEVQSGALAEMDNSTPAALVRALLEKAVPAGVEGLTVTVESVDVN